MVSRLFLSAIFWALYGGLHHVYNNAGTTNKCSVTLEFETPRMTIYRQKRPELLRLTMTNPPSKYEDQVAQSIISGLFGPKEIWMACCYIPQGSRSYLLTASNADKMDLLNVLSFNTENPDTFISKIDTTLTGVTADFTVRQTSFTSECEQFNREITQANLDMTLHLSPDDRKIMEITLDQDKKRYVELSARYNEEQRQRGILFSLQETQNSLMKQLSDLPVVPVEETTRLESELALLNEKASSLPYLSAYHRLQNELSSTDQRLKETPSQGIDIVVTESDISRATMEKQQYEENYALSISCSCSYDEGSISSEIAKMSTLLELQPKISHYAKLKSERIDTQQKLATLPRGNRETRVTEEEIATATLQQQQYQEGVNACEALSCPYEETAISEEVSRITMTIDLQPVLQSYQRLKAELATVDSSLGETHRSLIPFGTVTAGSERTFITEEDISVAVMATSAYEEGLHSATSLDVAYSESAITSEMAQLSSRIDLQPVLQTYQRLKSELKSMSASLEETLNLLLPFGTIIPRTVTEEDISVAVMATSAYEEGLYLSQSLDISYSESTITTEMARLSSRIDLQPILQTYQRLKSELKSIDSALDDTLRALVPYGNVSMDRPVTDDDISGAVMATSAYEEGSHLAKSLNVPYSEPAIVSEMAQLSSWIDLQPRLQTIIRYLTLTSQINNLVMSGSVATDEDVANAREALSKLHASMGVLKCPHCEKPVRAVNGFLLPGESLPPTPEEMERANYNLQVVTANRRRGLEIASLSQEVESLKNLCNPDNIGDLNTLPSPWTSQEMAMAKTRLSALSKIRVVIPPTIGPQLLRLLRTKETLESKKNLLVSEIEKLTSNYPIDSLESPLDNLQVLRSRLSALSKIRVVAPPKESPQLLRLLRTQMTLESKKNSLVSEIEKITSNYPLDSLESPLDNIQMLRSRLSALSKIRVVSPPKESPQLLRLLRTQMTLESKKDSLVSEIEKITSNYPVASLEAPPANLQMLRGRLSALSKIRLISAPLISPEMLRSLFIRQTLESREQDVSREINILIAENSLDQLESPPVNVTQLKTRMTTISRIRVVSPPQYDPSILRLVLTRRVLEQRRQEIISEIEKLPSLDLLASLDATMITSNISRIRGRLAEISESTTRRKILSTQIDDLMVRMSAIILDDSLKDRIQTLASSIEKMGSQLVANEKIDLFMGKQSALEKKRGELEKVYKDMTTLQRMKTIALEVECHTLQTTVDSINAALSDIATHLFDDPIAISLQLFKALKTKDRVKPTVNITITYRGGEYDNISQLSGGEGDRISLAITLALARINSCPLLLLDECMASLDANLKESCLKTLRRNLGNHKTVISINHEGTEGTYDAVVTLGS